jgi:hypothetical protein
MNLIQFYEKISSDNTTVGNTAYFSEEVTIFNILNGTFPDEDILHIGIMSDANPTFKITLRNETIASCAEDNMKDQIVQGAYYPLYRISVNREGSTLYIKLIQL